MVKLTVLQQGNISYASGDLTMQFEPEYIAKVLTISAGSQFVYYGETYIVEEPVSDIFGSIPYVDIAETQEDNITQADVSFNLECVQAVQDIAGASGVIYATSPNAVAWRATSLSVSTSNTDFSGLVAGLEAAGFIRLAAEMSDDTTRDFYINRNGVASASAYTPTAPTTYTLPDGTQLVGYSLYTYTADFTGILAGDTLNTVTTGLGTITLNLPCVTGPDRTAIAAAITAYLLAAEVQYGTVAVTEPAPGDLRIVIPTSSLAFTEAKATISTAPTMENFVIT